MSITLEETMSLQGWWPPFRAGLNTYPCPQSTREHSPSNPLDHHKLQVWEM